MEIPVTGGQPSTPEVAPKGRRIAAGIIDFLVIPFFLGLVLGMVLLALNDAARTVIFVLINLLWVLFRDYIYSPGRAMVGTKIISLTGGRISIGQAIVRNVLLVVPYVLGAGFACETTRILIRKSIIARRVLYCLFITFGILFVVGGIGAGNLQLIIAGVIGSLAVVFVFIKDKSGVCEGDRLMDIFAKTRVVLS